MLPEFINVTALDAAIREQLPDVLHPTDDDREDFLVGYFGASERKPRKETIEQASARVGREMFTGTSRRRIPTV